MWTRRALLTSAGLSLLSLGVAGQFQQDSTVLDRYFDDLAVEERAHDIDADTDSERLVRLRFVPARPLLSVRLEQRVDDASDPVLARNIDHDDDGWYALARRIGLEHSDRGTEQFVEVPRSRRLPDAPHWVAESRGFQPGSTGAVDVRGFERGTVLRVVAVPYGEDPLTVTEHAVGTPDSSLDR